MGVLRAVLVPSVIPGFYVRLCTTEVYSLLCSPGSQVASPILVSTLGTLGRSLPSGCVYFANLRIVISSCGELSFCRPLYLELKLIKPLSLFAITTHYLISGVLLKYLGLSHAPHIMLESCSLG